MRLVNDNIKTMVLVASQIDNRLIIPLFGHFKVEANCDFVSHLIIVEYHNYTSKIKIDQS